MSNRPQITLFYELLVVSNQEVETDAPDDWDDMTVEQRRAWCEEAWQDGLPNVISGNYKCDGEDV